MIDRAKPHYYISLACYIGIVISILGWTLFQGALATLPFVFLFQLLPILFPAKGLFEGKPYTFAWTSFLALYYFMLGVFDAAGEATQVYGLLLVVFSLGLFCFSLAFARIQGKANKQLSNNTAQDETTTDLAEPDTHTESSSENTPGQTLPWTPMIIGAFCLAPASFWVSAQWMGGSYAAMLLLPFLAYFMAIVGGFFVSFAIKLFSKGKLGFSSIQFIHWFNRFSFLTGAVVVAYYFLNR
jgi:uncharacterized membrane protein